MKKYLLITFLALCSTLQADYVLKYKMDTETQTLMYKNADSFKMIVHSEGEKSELYKVKDKTYMVSYDEGRANIVDMDEMMKMSQSMGFDPSMHSESFEKPKVKITKTGKSKKVAGIKGDVWIVSGLDDGKRFEDEVVVTKDKRVVKTMRALGSMISKMGGLEAQRGLLELQNGYVLLEADSMKLESFENKTIKSSEYQLPKGGKKQQIPSFGKTSTTSLDACYTSVCCGKTAGKSKVLSSSLKDSFKGYSLVGSGICDAMGLSSLMGIKSIEGALYKKGEDYIQITLNMDDHDGGMLRKTKKNLESGYPMGMVESIRNYSDKNVDGIRVVQGELVPMKQETMEYILNDTTTLTISRIKKSNKGIELHKVVDSNGGVSLEKLQKKLNSSNTAKSSNPIPEDIDVDEAVKMLKSFF